MLVAQTLNNGLLSPTSLNIVSEAALTLPQSPANILRRNSLARLTEALRLTIRPMSMKFHIITLTKNIC